MMSLFPPGYLHVSSVFSSTKRKKCVHLFIYWNHSVGEIGYAMTRFQNILLACIKLDSVGFSTRT